MRGIIPLIADLREFSGVIRGFRTCVYPSDIDGGALDLQGRDDVKPESSPRFFNIGHEEHELARPLVIIIDGLQVHQFTCSAVVWVISLFRLDIEDLVDLNAWVLFPIVRVRERIVRQVDLTQVLVAIKDGLVGLW